MRKCILIIVLLILIFSLTNISYAFTDNTNTKPNERIEPDTVLYML